MNGVCIFVAELVEDGLHGRSVFGGNKLTDRAFKPSGKRARVSHLDRGREQHRARSDEQKQKVKEKEKADERVEGKGVPGYGPWMNILKSTNLALLIQLLVESALDARIHVGGGGSGYGQ